MSKRKSTLASRSCRLQQQQQAQAQQDEEHDTRRRRHVLLQDWLQHDSLEFHYFSADQAKQIRRALLDWYDVHRRKLPWRGDAPPWQGSTADFATKQKINSSSSSSSQTKIQDFFNKKPETIQSAKQQQQQEKTTTFTVTPYGVWVSEIMLQQTRVEAVVPYWVRWMKAFPTVADLAAATPEQVNAHFAGLGFYRRARLLHQACQNLVEKHDGIMPQTADELMQLPGIGRYTACAIASIAHGEAVAVVDGNVCRVLSRLRGICNQIKAPALKDRYGWELAQQIIKADDASRPGDVNQALMELGATYCAPTGTGTDPGDPLKDFYWSTTLGQAYLLESSSSLKSPSLPPVKETTCPICINNGIALTLNKMNELMEKQQQEGDPKQSLEETARQCGHASLPMPPPKPTRREEVWAVAVLSSSDDGSFLMVKRPPTGLLAGQWEFPASCVWASETRVTGDTPIPAVPSSTRRKALNSLLGEILTNEDQVQLLPCAVWQTKRKVQDTSAEHIFSHIRHTMWIEHKEIPTSKHEGMMTRSWIDCQGREVRWMDADEMSSVGITSGVKKILKNFLKAKPSPSTSKKRRTK